MEREKNGQKSCNVVISHGNLPKCTKCVCSLVTTGTGTARLCIDVKRLHFLQNRKERWSWKHDKWLWKSHGKILCQVCGNPVFYTHIQRCYLVKNKNHKYYLRSEMKFVHNNFLTYVLKIDFFVIFHDYFSRCW